MARKTFDQKTKEKWLKIAREHQEADRFVQWERIEENETTDWMYRGCFFGFMMQTSGNVLDTASKEMKIPAWIVYIWEKIFEWLPKYEDVLRPVQLLEAIPTNKDTEKAWKRVMKRILLDEKYWAIAYSDGEENVISAIQQCAALYDMDVIDYESASSASSAAESVWSAWAAWSLWHASWAVRDAARAAAKSAAWYDAARSAWYAESAAWYVAARAAGSAKDRYQWLRDVLIEELQR